MVVPGLSPKNFSLRKSENVRIFPRLAFARGAYRDRHGRGKRDAMDVLARQTSDADADGEVVWSWRPWAGAKPVR